jgi:hypothetical protein
VLENYERDKSGSNVRAIVPALSYFIFQVVAVENLLSFSTALYALIPTKKNQNAESK